MLTYIRVCKNLCTFERMKLREKIEDRKTEKLKEKRTERKTEAGRNKNAMSKTEQAYRELDK